MTDEDRADARTDRSDDRADARTDRTDDRADERAIARTQREAVSLSRNTLWAILLVVWVMSCVTSAGVSWYFAGVSSDRSNAALSKIVDLQRQQGQDGLGIIYKADTKRCLDAVGARQVAIHNATVQAKHEAGVLIPPPLKPCSESVRDPNAPTVGSAVHIRG